MAWASSPSRPCYGRLAFTVPVGAAETMDMTVRTVRMDCMAL